MTKRKEDIIYSEKIVWKWLKRSAEEQGAFITKMHPVTNAGMPDGLIHWMGRTFYVECKTTGEKCTPIQVEMHKRLKNYGIETYVLDTKIDNLYDLYVYATKTYDKTYGEAKREERKLEVAERLFDRRNPGRRGPNGERLPPFTKR